MINIEIMGSSSRGNSIIISDGKSSIILDAGVPLAKMARSKNFGLTDAVLITHEHMDHTKYVFDLMNRGIDCYMSPGTWGEIHDRKPGIYRPSGVTSGTIFNIDRWRITCLDSMHDAAEPLSFIIDSIPTGKRIFYSVDSAVITYRVPDVNYWLLEANYDDRIIKDGGYHSATQNRVKKSHMSFQNVKKYLMANDLSKTESIHLLHLSEVNADPETFIRALQALTAVPVIIN